MSRGSSATASSALSSNVNIVKFNLLCVSTPLFAAPDVAFGQLSARDIDALRARGEREGWTFTVGANPAAADTCGVPVLLTRFLAVTIGSGIVGIGGAYLSLATTPMWIENMSAGRGWIAVALVIFASWSSYRALAGAYLFGGITAMQLRFQAMGTTVSAHILQMLPYFFTILAICDACGHQACDL